MAEPTDMEARELQIDFRVGTNPRSGRPALVILVEGLPETIPMTHLVAAIVGSLRSTLGAEIVESVVRHVH